MDFVAIDFETATSCDMRICSMGICVVENNKVCETKEILIKPDPFEFDECNINIHHITPDMVNDRGIFKDYWNEIFPYLNDRIIIAHNAAFDIGGLVKNLHRYNLIFPSFRYICTVKLSQKAYPDLPSHKLNNLAQSLNITFDHHHAADDAYACAMVFLNILNDYNLNSIEEIENRFNIEIGHVYPGLMIPCKKNKKNIMNKSKKFTEKNTLDIGANT